MTESFWGEWQNHVISELMNVHWGQVGSSGEKAHDPKLVQKLNVAAREGTYKAELFKDYTGKTVDDLWTEFTDTLRQKASP